MRRAAAVDANQAEIVGALRQTGVTVQQIHTLGRGVPDLLCGYRGVNVLLEIKDPDKPPSRIKLTEDEEKWHVHWRGQVAIVHNVKEALAVIFEAVVKEKRKA